MCPKHWNVTNDRERCDSCTNKKFLASWSTPKIHNIKELAWLDLCTSHTLINQMLLR